MSVFYLKNVGGVTVTINDLGLSIPDQKSIVIDSNSINGYLTSDLSTAINAEDLILSTTDIGDAGGDLSVDEAIKALTITSRFDTDNPHTTTITQTIDADSTVDPDLTVSNLNSLVDGSDTSLLHNHNTDYYTKTELQTSGDSTVHWDNITNTPTFGSLQWQSPVICLLHGKGTSAPVAAAEVTEITCPADISGSLSGKYWTLNSPTTNYYVWYNTGSSTDPAPVGLTEIEVSISANDDEEAVALATKNAIDSLSDFGASVALDVVTITNASTGYVYDAANVDVGVSVNVTTQGADTPITGWYYLDTDDNHIYRYNGSTWDDQGVPIAGDRVIFRDGPYSDDKIYQYSGSAWVAITPSDNWAVLVNDDGTGYPAQYVYDDDKIPPDWIKIASVNWGDHSTLTGRDAIDSHPASAISFNNTINNILDSDNIQDAIDEISSEQGVDIDNVIFVALNGNDSATGVTIGTMANPYATISAAITSIPITGPGAASSTNRYIIFVMAGDYEENIVLNKAWVYIVSIGIDSCRIKSSSGNTVTLSCSTAEASGISNLTIISDSSTTTDNALLITGNKPLIRNVKVNASSGARTAYINGAYNQMIDNSEFHDGTFRVDAGIITFSNSKVLGGNTDINGGTFRVINGDFYYNGGDAISQDNGTVYLVSARLTSGMGSKDFNQAGGTVYWGWVEYSDTKCTFSGTKILLFRANSLSYNNITSGLTATDVQEAIDELATEGNVDLDNVFWVAKNGSDINPDVTLGTISNPYLTVQAAINAFDDLTPVSNIRRARILVMPGVYAEDIVWAIPTDAHSFLTIEGNDFEGTKITSLDLTLANNATYRTRLVVKNIEITSTSSAINPTVKISEPGGGTVSNSFIVFDNIKATSRTAAAIPEETEVTLPADTSGSLSGKYWTLNSPTTNYYVWYNTGSSTEPTVSGTGIEVAIIENDDAETVALATKNAIDSESDFSATVLSDVVTVTNISAGNAIDAVNGDMPSGFTIDITIQGEDNQPIIKVISEGDTGTKRIEFIDSLLEANGSGTNTIAIDAETGFIYCQNSNLYSYNDTVVKLDNDASFEIETGSLNIKSGAGNKTAVEHIKNSTTAGQIKINDAKITGVVGTGDFINHVGITTGGSIQVIINDLICQTSGSSGKVNVPNGILATGAQISKIDGTPVTLVFSSLLKYHHSKNSNYNNVVSGLTAVNVQDAIDELDNSLDDAITDISDHIGDTDNPHSTTLTQAISADGTADPDLSVTNLNTLVDDSNADELHIHSAAAITYDNGGSDLVATNVQDAIDEIDSVLDNLLPKGTAFPILPVPDDGDMYYRTDLSMTFQYDGSRSKWLSITQMFLDWGSSNADGTYLNIHGALATQTGYLMPRNGTIISVTAKTASGNLSKGLQIHRNHDSLTPLKSFSLSSGSFNSISENINFNSGDYLQVYANSTGAAARDLVVMITIAWNGV